MIRKIEKGDKLEIEQGDVFYSIYFNSEDPSEFEDIEIMEHEAAFDYYTSDFEGNIFATKEQAELVREFVYMFLNINE